MNKRGGALDRKDLNRGARGDGLGFVVGPRGPDLAADADPPAERCDFLDNDRGPPDQSRRSRPQQRRLADVADRQWPHHPQASPRRDGESGELEGQAKVYAADDGRCQSSDGQQPERQRSRQDLGDPEQRGQDQPGNPRLHGHSRSGRTANVHSSLRPPALSVTPLWRADAMTDEPAHPARHQGVAAFRLLSGATAPHAKALAPAWRSFSSGSVYAAG